MLVTIDIFKSTQGVEESERSKRASFIFPVVYFLLWPPLLWNMNLQVKQLFFFYIQVQHNNKLIKASWCQSTIVRLHSQTPFLLNHTHILLHTFRNILLTLHISYHSNNALSPFSIVHPFSFLQINPNEIKCTFLKASPPAMLFSSQKKRCGCHQIILLFCQPCSFYEGRVIFLGWWYPLGQNLFEISAGTE